MSEAIIAAIITGGVSLAGVIFSTLAAGRKTEASIRTAQAVTDTKLEELTRQVEKHNTVIERTYKLEGQMAECQHDIRDIKNKIGG